MEKKYFSSVSCKNQWNKPFYIYTPLQGLYMVHVLFKAVYSICCFFMFWALRVLWVWCYVCWPWYLLHVLGHLVSLIQALTIKFPEIQEMREKNYTYLETKVPYMPISSSKYERGLLTTKKTPTTFSYSPQ